MGLDEKSGTSNSGATEQYTIAPRMFKHLVGKNHPEFSSNRQQDVSEYFMHFLDVMTRNEKKNQNLSRLTNKPKTHTSSLFEFHLETKLKCNLDGHDTKVIYTNIGPQTLFNCLELRLPLDAASVPNDSIDDKENPDMKRNKIDLNDPRNLIPFPRCLSTVLESGSVEYRKHPSINADEAQFLKTVKFHTFPKYLMLKLQRYYAGPNWVQMKINCQVDVPIELDLSSYRGSGLQDGEVQINNDEAANTAENTQDTKSIVTADPGIVTQLISMGFSENGAKRAAIATNNVDADIAMVR